MSNGVLAQAKRFGKDAVAGIVARTLPRSIMFDKRYFPLWEKRGFHVTLDHFYEPVPSTRELVAHRFDNAGDFRGMDFRDADQIEILNRFAALYRPEYDALPSSGLPGSVGFHFGNDTFEECDAEVLHCMVRDAKPKRIVEIGSGFSTRLIGSALEANAAEGASCDGFVVIDPFADRTILDRIPRLTQVIEKPVQRLDPCFFDCLSDGDILFIDSSHVLKAGSDVQYEFLHILPRLQRGVIIHVHDVFLPEDYPQAWLTDRRWFWSEQYLLQAFLSFNERFRILWAGHYMHLKYPSVLSSAFQSYARRDCSAPRQWPASFWMKRIS
jgi:hypothetical protein